MTNLKQKLIDAKLYEQFCECGGVFRKIDKAPVMAGRHVHKCISCGEIEEFPSRYPLIMFKDRYFELTETKKGISESYGQRHSDNN